MRTGHPKKPLQVTPEEREKLEMLAKRPKSAQAIAIRARIVPTNSTHWSTRLMADKVFLRRPSGGSGAPLAFSPRSENFKLSKDPQFVEKVRDIVGRT